MGTGTDWFEAAEAKPESTKATDWFEQTNPTAGVPSPITMVKAAASQVNEKVRGSLADRAKLKDTTPLKFVPGLATNAVKDFLSMGPAISDLAGFGLRHIPRLARSTVDPAFRAEYAPEAIETAKQIGSGLLEGAKGIIKDPAEAAYQNPFTAITLVEGVGKSAAGAAAKAGLKGAEVAAEVGPTRAISRALVKRVAASNPSVARTLENRALSKATSQMVEKTRDEKFFGPRAEFDKELKTAQVTKLTPQEKETFIGVVSGMDDLPTDSRLELKAAVDWWAQKQPQEQANLIAEGLLTPEAAASRALQPLRATKLSEAAMSELTGSPHAHDLPFRQAAREWIGEMRSKGMKDPDIHSALASGNLSPEGWLQTTKKFGDAESKARIDQLDANLTASLAAKGREALYYPMLRDPDLMSHSLAGEHLPASANTQKVRPGFLKQSTGKLLLVNEFDKDVPRALKRANTAKLRWKTNQQIISNVTKDPKFKAREIRSPMDLQKGEKLFAPDGFLRLFRAYTDFSDKVMTEFEASGMMDDAMRKALEHASDKGLFEQATMGAAKHRLYAIPNAVYDQLLSKFAKTNPAVRVFFDKPNDWFRTNVLALRPAWIANNVVGSAIYGMLHGDTPKDFMNATDPRFVAKLPPGIVGHGLTADVGQMTHLGYALETDAPLLANVAKAIDKIEKAPVLAQIGTVADRMRSLNEGVETLFRGASYSKAVRKIARENVIRRAGKQALKTFDLLDEMDKLTPNQIDDAIREVNYFHNDYRAASQFERSVIRRVVPFAAFLKHQIALTASLPFNYPGRAAMLQGLEELGKEAANDAAPLPTYMRERGLVDLGNDVEVDGRKFRMFLSTTGSNPLIVGGGPGQMAEGLDPRDIIDWAASQTGPYGQIVKQAITKKDPFGRNFTDPKVIEQDGKFYELDNKFEPKRDKSGNLVETRAPRPNMAELAATSFVGPQVALTRRMIEPKADWTARPFSTLPSQKDRSVTTRTRELEALRYLTPASIILVDLDAASRGELRSQKFERRTVRAVSKAAAKRRDTLGRADGN